METLLEDPNQFPTEEIILAHLGEAKTLWQSFFQDLQHHHPDWVSEWRYYRDGKRWLMKTVQKSRTIFWLSLAPNSFVISFYFGDQLEPAILESDLPNSVKKAFQQEKRIGKIRPITIEVENHEHLGHVRSLIEIKLGQK